MNYHQVAEVVDKYNNGKTLTVTLKDGFYFLGGKSVETFDGHKAYKEALANTNEGRDNVSPETVKAIGEGLKPKRTRRTKEQMKADNAKG